MNISPQPLGILQVFAYNTTPLFYVFPSFQSITISTFVLCEPNR